MKLFWLASTIATVSLLGCGGGNGASTTPTGGGQPAKAKRATLRLSSTDATPFGSQAKKATVFLGITDETGRTASHTLGVFDGVCQSVAPASASQLLAMQCWDGPRGVALGVQAQRSEVLVTKLPLDQGIAPDPFSVVELSRIALELGTKIEAAPF